MSKQQHSEIAADQDSQRANITTVWLAVGAAFRALLAGQDSQLAKTAAKMGAAVIRTLLAETLDKTCAVIRALLAKTLEVPTQHSGHCWPGQVAGHKSIQDLKRMTR